MATLTLTFLFTNIEGSTAMVQRLEGAYAGVPAGAGLKDLGLHRLKGMGRPEQIFQLQAEGLPAAICCGRRATRRC